MQGWVTSWVSTRGNPAFGGVSYDSILDEFETGPTNYARPYQQPPGNVSRGTPHTFRPMGQDSLPITFTRSASGRLLTAIETRWHGDIRRRSHVLRFRSPPGGGPSDRRPTIARRYRRAPRLNPLLFLLENPAQCVEYSFSSFTFTPVWAFLLGMVPFPWTGRTPPSAITAVGESTR